MTERSNNRAVKPYEFIDPKAHLFGLAGNVVDKIGELHTGPDGRTWRIAEWPVDTAGTHYGLEAYDYGSAGKIFHLHIYDRGQKQESVTIRRQANDAYEMYHTDAKDNTLEEDDDAKIELQDRVYTILNVDRQVSEKIVRDMYDTEFAALAGRLVLSRLALRPEYESRIMNREMAAKLAREYEQTITDIHDEELETALETGDKEHLEMVESAIASRPYQENAALLGTDMQHIVGGAMSYFMVTGGRWHNTIDTTVENPSERIRRPA